jgi:hypothetical protein
MTTASFLCGLSERKGFLAVEWAAAPKWKAARERFRKKFLTEAQRTQRKKELGEITSARRARDCFSPRTLRLCEREVLLF